ncbi:MAG: hypothetical protein GC179_22545 [Anaerolineaceae bacterium]|nr:hypothetical protein [Anaerolineaceae bacterium]
MTKQVLRIVFFITGLFLLIILAFRLLPNDDDAIRALLLPSEGCPAPCFMNIRAGVTDSMEAARLISKHKWAQSTLFYMRSLNDMYERYVLWQWSGQQPAGVSVQRQGQMRIYKNQAVGMIVDTTIPLGSVWLVLGATDKGTVSLAETRSDTEMMLVMVYPKEGLLVRVVVPKHLSQAALWGSRVEIESSSEQSMAFFKAHDLPVLTRIRP